MDLTTRRTNANAKTPSPPKSVLSNVRLPWLPCGTTDETEPTPSGSEATSCSSKKSIVGAGDEATGSKHRVGAYSSSQNNTLKTAAFMPHSRPIFSSVDKFGATSRSRGVTETPGANILSPKDEELVGESTIEKKLVAQTPECDRQLKRLEQSGMLSRIRKSFAPVGTLQKSGSQFLNKTIMLPPHQQENDSDEDPEEEAWRQKQIEMLCGKTSDYDDVDQDASPLDREEENSEERDSGCSTPSDAKRSLSNKPDSCFQQDSKPPVSQPVVPSASSASAHPVKGSHSSKTPAATAGNKKCLASSSTSTTKNALSKSSCNDMSSTKSTSKSGRLNLEAVTVNGKPFHVLRELGKGGSSTVQEVFDPVHKRLFAMKIVDLSRANDGERRAFKNEINLLKKLNECERVVRIHDFEYKRPTDQLILVMERGDADLANVLKSFVDTDKNQVDPDVVKFYWKEMLKAVKEIHSHGIVHADLKPVNFITVAGKLKLIDFGIANALDPNATSIIKDHQVGTINYMSPEALTNRSTATNTTVVKYNQKSDIWSLGCILYNLVYGYPPFGHYKDLLAKFQAITNPKHKIKFGTSRAQPALVDCIKLCLQYDPTKRPTTDELLRHPYLTNDSSCQSETSLSTSHPVQQNAAHTLLSQINGFTPNRMRQLSKVVEQMSKMK